MSLQRYSKNSCSHDIHANYCQRGHLAIAQAKPYIAMTHFETALTHHRDHPSAIVGLSNILLNIYEQKLLPPPSTATLSEFSINATQTTLSSSPSTSAITAPASSSSKGQPRGPLGIAHQHTLPTPTSPPTNGDDKTKLQDRIAARDRASFLLSTLTKLGKGWNYSEAWFALARAYESQGQMEKAKEVLWWCVELEDSRPVRDWSDCGSGGYVL